MKKHINIFGFFESLESRIVPASVSFYPDSSRQATVVNQMERIDIEFNSPVTGFGIEDVTLKNIRNNIDYPLPKKLMSVISAENGKNFSVIGLYGAAFGIGTYKIEINNKGIFEYSNGTLKEIGEGFSSTTWRQAGGSVENFGADWYNFGYFNIPPSAKDGNVIAVAAGANHDVALKSDGTVVSWGKKDESNVPAGINNVVQISAGWGYTAALKEDGTVETWGNGFRRSLSGEKWNDIVCISAQNSVLGLKRDGTIVQEDVPLQPEFISPENLKNVVHISSGMEVNVAILADGSVVPWGHSKTSLELLKIPNGLGFVRNAEAGTSNVTYSDKNGQIYAVGYYTEQGTLDFVSAHKNPRKIIAHSNYISVLTNDNNLFCTPIYSEFVNYSNSKNVIDSANGWIHSVVLTFVDKPEIDVPLKELFAIAITADLSVNNSFSELHVYENGTRELLNILCPFPGYKGEFYADTGDINGDSYEDIIVGSGNGSKNGHVVIYDGKRLVSLGQGSNPDALYSQNGAVIASIYAFVGYSSGVSVRLADFTGDNCDDIVLVPGSGAGRTTPSHLRIWDGRESMKDFSSGKLLPYDYRWELVSQYVFGDAINRGGGLSINIEKRKSGGENYLERNSVIVSQLFGNGIKSINLNYSNANDPSKNKLTVTDRDLFFDGYESLNGNTVSAFYSDNAVIKVIGSANNQSLDTIYFIKEITSPHGEIKNELVQKIDNIFSGLKNGSRHPFGGLRLVLENVDSDKDPELLITRSNDPTVTIFDYKKDIGIWVHIDSFYFTGESAWV